MQLQISDLTTTRQWGAVTGFTPVQFEQLLVLFTQSYFELFGQTVKQRHSDIEVTPSLVSEEELLRVFGNRRETPQEMVVSESTPSQGAFL